MRAVSINDAVRMTRFPTILHFHASSASPKSATLIAYDLDDRFTTYVVWTAVLSDNGNANLTRGEYFTNQLDAIHEWNKRRIMLDNPEPIKI